MKFLKNQRKSCFCEFTHQPRGWLSCFCFMLLETLEKHCISFAITKLFAAKNIFRRKKNGRKKSSENFSLDFFFEQLFFFDQLFFRSKIFRSTFFFGRLFFSVKILKHFEDISELRRSRKEFSGSKLAPVSSAIRKYKQWAPAVTQREAISMCIKNHHSAEIIAWASMNSLNGLCRRFDCFSFTGTTPCAETRKL